MKMILATAVLLLAFVGSHVSAQLKDCTGLSIAPNTHHALDVDNCRRFIQCDNANNGKYMWCSEGTVYDNVTGLCLAKASCQNYEDCPPFPNDNVVIQFSSRLCSYYYRLQCREKTWTFEKCPNGQYFNPTSKTCSSGTPLPGTCVTLGPNDIIAGCGANDMASVPGEPCKFSHPSTPGVIKTCAPGTAFDPLACFCLPTMLPECLSTLDIAGCTERSVIPTNVAALWRLSGQDMGQNPFAIKMSFVISTTSSPSTRSIFSHPSAIDCSDGLTFGVEVTTESSSVEVTVTIRSTTSTARMAVLRGTINNIFGPQTNVILYLVFNNKDQTVFASVNNQRLTQQPTISALDVANEGGFMMSSCAVVKSTDVTFNEIAFWRNCENIQII